MKLLIVASGDFFSDYGGGQVYVKNLVDELIDRGLELSLATPGDPSASVRYYRDCPVFAFSSGAVDRVSDEIAALLQKIKPDLVHAHGAKRVFAEACNTAGIPCIVTAHHGGILCPAGTLLNYRDRICAVRASHKECLPCVLKNIRAGIFSWQVFGTLPLDTRLRIGRILRARSFLPYITPVGTTSLSIQERMDDWEAIVNNVSMLVAPSSAIAESMIRNGASADRVKKITHGIIPPDRTYREKDRKEDDDLRDGIRFFYVGRICHVKGLHVLLGAFSGISGKTELHIIGGAGNKVEDRYMRRLKSKYSKSRNIVWHGKTKKQQVNDMISGFDVMVHPAIYLEVFGLTIAEALAMGKPVIATRCGGAEEQIKNGVNGLLVEPNEIQPLRSAMQKFVDKAVDSATMSEAGPGAVKSLSRHASEIINLYHQVTAGNT
ncbi:MAG: glycosyltransferase family 4 protein [Candidatus Omnitrophica bacterium]|nr:glycosyltransferase family 4 protein [Candidatus Omnitrophota bacterium]